MDWVAEPPIRTKRSAGSCGWAMPTLFLPAPFWFEAESCPWTCMRDSVPRVLSTTDRCATCLYWKPRQDAPPASTLHPERAGSVCEAAVPLMVDWLGGFPPPHEIE
jgi:hypothetical protein